MVNTTGRIIIIFIIIITLSDLGIPKCLYNTMSIGILLGIILRLLVCIKIIAL